ASRCEPGRTCRCRAGDSQLGKDSAAAPLSAKVGVPFVETLQAAPCDASCQSPSFRRSRAGALVEKQLRAPLAFFGRQGLRVLRRTGGDGEAALDCGARAQLLEPALEVFELFDVLLLPLPVHRPWV